MLYLVATPIGNLGDLSARAVETLGAVALIASEDTRKTGILLKRNEIRTPQVSFHEHNEIQAVERIVARLKAGDDVALVTDAGTPGVADPGYRLVRRCIDEGLELTMVPGPSALVMAVVLSGLAVHSFTFRGFPPRKSGARRTWLQVDRESPHTLVFYESPHRLHAFLRDCLEVYGNRQAAVCKDLTKLFERIQRGSLRELTTAFAAGGLKGEYAVVVAGCEDGKAAKTEP